MELLRAEMQIISLGGDGNILFAGGSITTSFPDTQMIYANPGTGWYLVDQQIGGENFFNPRFGYSAIFSPASGIIYSSTWGIFKWEGKQWSKVIQSERGLPGIGGSNENNIFVVGGGPTIWHWNGHDWQKITAVTKKLAQDVVLTGVWTDGTEAFSVGTDGSRGYVLHGK